MASSVKAVREFDADDVARRLREAMKVMGTDEEALIVNMAPLGAKKLKRVAASYARMFTRDLEKDLKDETSNDLEHGLVGLLRSPAEFAAWEVEEAVSKVNVDENTVIDILCTQTDEELKATDAAYRDMYNKPMLGRVLDRLGRNNLGLLMEQLLQRVLMDDHRKTPDASELEMDVVDLYEAGEGQKVCANEVAFVRRLTQYSKDYIERISARYTEKYGKPLFRAVEKEFSGDTRRALIALSMPPHEYWVRVVRNSTKRYEDVLVRGIIGTRETCLPAVVQCYVATYEQTLTDALRHDLSGDFRHLMLLVLEHWSGG